MHYGHGYVFFVEQGYAKFGEVVPDLSLVVPFNNSDGFNWVGYALPGDSGSGVMDDAGIAVQDLSRRRCEPIPDALAPAVLRDRALDLVCGGRRAPDEVGGERAVGAGQHGTSLSLRSRTWT